MSAAPRRGLSIIYTGPGKGKTTAALGMALRALGHGLQLGRGFVKHMGDKKPFEEHLAAAKDALKVARERIVSGAYDLIVLDELIYAIDYAGVQLVTLEEVLGLLDAKPPALHLVLTGRDAPQALIDRADLVTEMREVKHPWGDGDAGGQAPLAAEDPRATGNRLLMEFSPREKRLMARIERDQQPMMRRFGRIAMVLAFVLILGQWYVSYSRDVKKERRVDASYSKLHYAVLEMLQQPNMTPAKLADYLLPVSEAQWGAILTLRRRYRQDMTWLGCGVLVLLGLMGIAIRQRDQIIAKLMARSRNQPE
ncbi:MAG: cob(I)yrinic acid a,c-diamide adenosyltransferase [Candidatus Omnitrophica bacterium]|nr:cob(I)yrinic acid a,c-diamide adenosyltransferase [Candidatus Omnitrophota bacterium]